MPRSSLVVFVLAALYVAAYHAKVWDRCQLARALVNTYGFPRDQMDIWMCIAFRESNYNSSHINTENLDGSKDYGLFQVNNRYWCHNSESPQPDQNKCQVPCNTVLKHMNATVECIKTMYRESSNTWDAWTTYPYCLLEGSNITSFTADCNL